MSLEFDTKSKTLLNLYGKIQSAVILPQIHFEVLDWIHNPDKILKKISVQNWDSIPLIIRSSALSEDSKKESLAGHFISVSNCLGIEQISQAIEKVISSYKDQKDRDQVFIQPMLTDVKVSGVVFTLDPNTGSYYYVINYDDVTQTTDSVTAGNTNNLKTFYCFKDYKIKSPNYIVSILAMAKELESLFSYSSLDIEFAIDNKNNLYLFQVRPLIIKNKTEKSIFDLKNSLEDIHNKLSESTGKHPYLYGEKTIYGVMPDWNPAEIIGIRPKSLALSLYKEMITDSIWAYQRDNYGYRNLRSFPLLLSFHGLPYIDVRVSFNSFIPADVEGNLANKLANYYINQLQDNPSNHDKVEFEIIYSCYTLDLPLRISKLLEYDFNKAEIEILSSSLRNLTNRIIHSNTGLWKTDIAKIHFLEKRRDEILNSNLSTVSKIYWLIEDCKRYGTLPFAGLARAGFIAIQLLKSLIQVGILSDEEYSNFMGSLDSISSQMNTDLENLSKKAFLKKYGHLRPGTYDILSYRYDEEPDRYFDWDKLNSKPNSKIDFTLSLKQLKQIEHLMKEHKLENDILGFFDFIKSAIEGREYSKFIFTKSLSETLSLIKKLCIEENIKIEDSPYLNFAIVKDLYSSSGNIKEVLERSIQVEKEIYKTTQSILLPPLILSPDDIWAFHLPYWAPNYITLKKVNGKVVLETDISKDLSRKIVFIKSADPGYDWIFSKGIAGFITMYGGVNSHMAIRAGELGIPAVIGCGELLYQQWSKASLLEIDCESKQVKVLK